MPITALPNPPSRSDPANFAERADAFMAALPGFAQEANALQSQVDEAAQTAGENAGAAAGSAQDAANSRTQAGQRAAEAASAANVAGVEATAAASAAALAGQWATKTGAPVAGGEFSAKHYAQLAAQGMGLPVFARANIPNVDVGPIFVPTQGAMEWRNGRYTVLSGDHGQCRLVFVSAAECRLVPFGGNGLMINGRQYRIDPAGIPITTASTAANGRYWVFAKDDGTGGIALELTPSATTAYSTHTDGATIKTGDPTRTLVGWLGTTAGNTFSDSASNNRFVASWFNKRKRSTVEQAGGTLGSTTAVGLGNGRSLFNWAGEEVSAVISGYGVLSSNNYLEVQARRDSVTTIVPGVAAGRSAGGPASVSGTTSDTLSEGASVYQLFGFVSSGTVALALRLECSTFI